MRNLFHHCFISFFSAPTPKSPSVLEEDGNSDEEREISDDYDSERCL